MTSSPHVVQLAVEASIAHSVNEVSRVLDSKMSEFEQRLERQIGRAAVVAAANSAISGTSTSEAPRALALAVQQPPIAPQQPYTYAPMGPPHPAAATYVSAPPPHGGVSFPVASESLVFLTMSKADAAEKATADLRAEFMVNLRADMFSSWKCFCALCSCSCAGS